MRHRRLLLVGAVLLAALGAGLVLAYANNANARALASQNPVRVVVAAVDIPAGTSVRDAKRKGMLQEKTIARDARVPNALSPDSLPGLEDKVALSTIYTGEQVVAAEFGNVGAVSSLGIPPGMLAVSVQLTDPARVAGFVAPGSDVAVFLSVGGGGTGAFTRLLLPRARVVAVGPSTVAPLGSQPATATPGGEQVPRAILTLALNQGDAEKVVFAGQQGQLYFALLTDRSVVSKTPGVTLGNLFN